MMSKDNHSISKRQGILAAFLLAFAFMLAQPAKAQAQWVTNGNNINNTNTDNVGIGTTSPLFKLHVVGGIFAAGPSATYVFQDRSSGRSWAWWGYTDTARLFNGSIDVLGITPAGNVGIGTITPGGRLHINGGYAISGLANPGNTFYLNSAGASPNAGQLVFGDNTGWKFHIGTVNAGNFVERLTVMDTGNVGIGITTPFAKLDVMAVGGSTAGIFRGDISNGNEFSGQLYLYTSGPANTRVRIGFADSANGAGISQIESARYPGGGGYLSFITRLSGDGSMVERMRIDNSGNVGIGTTTPTNKLHVVGDGKVTGNLTVDGNIAAKYQDMAEWVPASEQIPAGTVVVLDTTKSNQVISSSQAYDTRVAGVISEKPGIALGESGNNKVLVATTGRVKVKVDATRAPIRVGDLLVTSDKQGVAMKSEPLNLGGALIHRPGTLIGKALEPMDKGVGEILVLLSLQ